MYTTIISTGELGANLGQPNWLILDVRFDLGNLEWGRQQHAKAHIPSARYLHLNDDLSSEPTGRNGRHPLPPLDNFVALLSELGVSRDTQIVAYDQGSMLYVGRVWWMLRYLGHDAVAVLDGGFAAWQREDRPTQSAQSKKNPTQSADFAPQVRSEMRIDADTLLNGLAQRAHVIVDARGSERYRGENETIDPVGGHIPGAVNRPFGTNLDADGKLLPREQLRAQFAALLNHRDARDVVHSCGSGVSACANILAMEHAGLSGSRLYVGSWSEWSSDPSRPTER